jgi:hypothetical protein
MKQPLGGQAKPAGAGDSKDHLPALGDFSKPASSFGGKPLQGGRSLPGWKPPPQRKEAKVDTKVPGQYQIDVANRLSKGLSSSRQQNDEDKMTSTRNSSKMIVSARHRIYSNTCTSSGSAAGSIYTSSSLASHSHSGQGESGGGGGVAGHMYGNSSTSSSSNGLLDPFGTSGDHNPGGYYGIEIALNQRANGGRYISSYIM